MTTTNIGDRFKRYEKASSYQLTPKIPVIVRIDGKAFHTYTKHMNKPFDNELINAMIVAAQKTAKEMQGCEVAYIQSDEASFLLSDIGTFETEAWFNHEINKIVSVSASLFTGYFNQYMGVDELAFFDSRASSVPEDDWANYFVWRQRDWERNSLQMVARHHYSHKELENKDTAALHELLYEKGLNWANLKEVYKNGTFLFKDGDYKPVHHKMTYNNLTELVKLHEEDNE